MDAPNLSLKSDTATLIISHGLMIKKGTEFNDTSSSNDSSGNIWSGFRLFLDVFTKQTM